MKTSTMIGTLLAASSSAASAFAPRTNVAFRHSATRAYSRSAAALMANPKGMCGKGVVCDWIGSETRDVATRRQYSRQTF
jgi:hypothetical protein